MAAYWRKFFAVMVALMSLTPATSASAEEDAIEHGEYLVRAGGCISCHTATGGQPFAGGRALATPFGTFYSPNITPDPETGIGRWTDAQFLRALREGVRPDGANYFPVFPYPSFTGISDGDALAIKAYLFSRPPVHQENKPHDVGWPFSWRPLQTGWNFLFFDLDHFSRHPNTAPPITEALISLPRSPIAANVTRRAICSVQCGPACHSRGRPMGRTGSLFRTSHPTPARGSANGSATTSSSYSAPATLLSRVGSKARCGRRLRTASNI